METTIKNDPISENWEDDCLNRIEVARFLTTYLNGIYAEDDPDLGSGHFVLNLNATWGHGKTFLLKNWAADLSKERYPVVIFDAWKNDFSKDPLVGFVSGLSTSLMPWFQHVAPIKAAMEKAMDTAKKFIGIAASVLKSPGISQGLDAASGVPVAGAAVEAAVAYSDRAFNKHTTTQELIDQFRSDLTKVIEAIEAHQKELGDRRLNSQPSDVNRNIHLPLYIFIDELDRCRPTYAIELLENIKHLFGVKGVVFVVATNKEQLCHSIKAVYGNSFDAAGYLGRFFDQEYTLPEPDNKRYARYLLDRYKITSDERLFSPIEKKNDSKDHITDLFALYSDAFKLPLRDQGQIVRRLKAILMWYRHDHIYFDFLIFLLMLHKKSESAFNKLLGLEATIGTTSFEESLREVFDGRAKMNLTHYPSNSGGIKTMATPLSQIILNYLSHRHTNLRKIMDEIDNSPTATQVSHMFHNEAIKNKSPNLSFAQYPELVKQVGHLES